MKKKALIFELMQCHHELLPSWIWSLYNAGYEVSLFTNPLMKKHRSIISNMKGLTFVHLTSMPIDFTQYSIIINNSLYPTDTRSDVPVTHSVLHATADKYNFAAANTKIISLGPHQDIKLKLQGISSVWAPPVYFGEIDSQIVVSHKKFKRILVQGVVEKFRRNYGCVVELTNKYKGLVDFEFTLMGDGGENYVKSLQLQTKSGDKYIKHVNNNTFDMLFQKLRHDTDWIMPCIDDTFKHEYFTNKITSSVMMAIGHDIPMIIHAKLASIYGLENDVNCLTYENSDQLSFTFLKAITLNAETYIAMKTSVSIVRKTWTEKLKAAFWI